MAEALVPVPAYVVDRCGREVVLCEVREIEEVTR